VLICGYAMGVFGTRRIAAKLHDASHLLRAWREQHPCAPTTRQISSLHLDKFTALPVQVAHPARELGLTERGSIAVDGIHIKANASHRQVMQ
jgi:hypothetical protein